MSYRLRLALAALAFAALTAFATACGKKGALYLPADAAPPPASDADKRKR